MFKGATSLLKHLTLTLMWLYHCNLNSTLTPVNIYINTFIISMIINGKCNPNLVNLREKNGLNLSFRKQF